MAEPVALMHVRSELEGDDVCERLRAAGIKCAVARIPDVNSLRAIWGGAAPDVLTVLVHDSDLEQARLVVDAAFRDVGEQSENGLSERGRPG